MAMTALNNLFGELNGYCIVLY